MNKLEFDRVAGLAHLLEPYRHKLPTVDTETFSLSKEDMPLYQTYFEQVILPKVLEDGIAFGLPDNDCKNGVGSDGHAYRVEYYQLLMQCYRYLYLALSSGEVFLKHSGWLIADHSAPASPAEPPQEPASEGVK